MKNVRILVAATVAAGCAFAVPAEAQAQELFTYQAYDPAYSALVGKPCTLKTTTYLDTAAVPPVRVVSTHTCQI